MKNNSILLVVSMLVLAGCVTPKVGEWHNKLYERDFNTSMRKYYGRDFKICLSRALQASNEGLIDSSNIEPLTDDCLRQGGWFKATA